MDTDTSVEALRARAEWLTARHRALHRESAVHSARYEAGMLVAGSRLLSAFAAQEQRWRAYTQTRDAARVSTLPGSDGAAGAVAALDQAAGYRQAYEQFVAAYLEFDQAMRDALPHAVSQTQRMLALGDEFRAALNTAAPSPPAPDIPAAVQARPWQRLWRSLRGPGRRTHG